MPLNDFDSLSFFQRVLLTTDGTVTDLVSLYTGEPIHITKIAQEFITSDQPQALQLPKPEMLLQREILLSGETQQYIYAQSFFVMSRMSLDMQEQLLNTNTPIGLLWKESRLETFRVIIDQHRDQQPKLEEYFDGEPGQHYLSRSYLVYHRGQPLGLINEKFPASYFLSLP